MKHHTTVNNHNCTPEQQYLIHRARSARWEIERDRQKLPLRKLRWRDTAEAVVVTTIWLAIAAIAWAAVAFAPYY